MEKEYGNDYIVLTDEDGNEIELEHLDTYEINDQTYMAFIPAETDLESYDLMILKVEHDKESDEDILVSIEDEDELNKLFQIFSERLENLFEDEEDEDLDGLDDGRGIPLQ